jgi:hypothetical protein
MPDGAARGGAELAMPHHVTGNAADDCALYAALGLRWRDLCEYQQQADEC